MTIGNLFINKNAQAKVDVTLVLPNTVSMEHADTDLSLINEVKSGNRAAFKTIVERHEGKVAGVVKGMLGDTPEALDVGQEVFIRLYESIDKFKGDATLSTYIVRIAINLSLNELKRKKKKRTMFGQLTEAEHVKQEGDQDLKAVLNYEISRLDPEFRIVVTLRMIEGYSVEETATLLNIPVGTVMSRLYRAQQKLKQNLTGQYGYE